MPNSVMGDFVSQLRLAFHRLQDWAYPDQIDHVLFQAYMKTPHDVGGEPDAPAAFEEKEEEQWELNTFVTCEVSWRPRRASRSCRSRYRPSRHWCARCRRTCWSDGWWNSHRRG